jgi:inhibitor of KinA
MTETNIDYPVTVTPLAESALLVRLGDGESIDPDVVDTITALSGAIEAAQVAGILDLVPAYTTLLIEFDPAITDGDAIELAIRQIAKEGARGPERNSRVVIIPVAYGGDHGPDLEEMAGIVGLSSGELAKRHAEPDYRVACMGFSPGWAYLMGLPPELTVPRRSVPRTKVPAGSVAVGGGQTGVYPLETPGGWYLIGRTPLAMFDPDRAEPFLLQPGDHVRFAPIDEERYLAVQQELDGTHE